MLKHFILLAVMIFSFSARADEYTPSKLYQNIGVVKRDELIDAFRNGADANEKDAKFGLSLLAKAVSFNNDAEIISTIIANGAKINDRDRSGKTPLMHAVSFNNNPKIIEILLDNGADINAVDMNGITPLMYAAASQGSNIAGYAKRNINDTYTGKKIPSNFPEKDKSENCIEIVKLVMNNTKYVNAFDKMGKNVLSHAAASNNLPEIIYLFASTNPNFEDNAGNTPLFEAIAANQDMKIVEALFDIGADVNYKNKNGMAALSVASIGTRYPLMIDKLLEKGADVNAMDNFGKLPLFYAKNNPALNNSSIIKKLSK